MKRTVRVQMAVGIAAALAGASVAAAGAAPAAAVEPTSRLSADAVLTRATVPARFHVHGAFATDTPGAPAFTLTGGTLWFPDRAGTNGRYFPSCSAAQIARFGGNLSRCPRGSRIGGGTLLADALQLGVTVPGRIALFNGPGGGSITFNFQADNPALVNESIDAPLTQLPRGGRYGEKLTLVVPQPLQEILDDVWVGLREIDIRLTAAVRVGGVTYSYLRAPACPRWPLRHRFDFVDGTTGQTASDTADARVVCSDVRRRAGAGSGRR